MKNSYNTSKKINLKINTTIRNIEVFFFKLRFKRQLSIFSHLTFDEKYALYKTVQLLENSSVCVEIGSYFGASSCFIASALKSKGILYCIDTWGNHAMTYSTEDQEDEYLVERDTYEAFKVNTYNFRDQIRELRGWSTNVVSDFSKLEQKIDFIFIDGDHTYDGVKKDWNAYSPFLRKGSLVVFHDTGWADGVVKLIGEEVQPIAKLESRLPNMEIYKMVI